MNFLKADFDIDLDDQLAFFTPIKSRSLKGIADDKFEIHERTKLFGKNQIPIATNFDYWSVLGENQVSIYRILIILLVCIHLIIDTKVGEF